MSETVVNLRRARKARARAEAADKAAQNRLQFGISKADRTHAAAVQDLDRRRLDSHRREDSADPDNA